MTRYDNVGGDEVFTDDDGVTVNGKSVSFSGLGSRESLDVPESEKDADHKAAERAELRALKNMHKKK